MRIAYALFEGLTTYSNRAGEPVPGVAAELGYFAPDGTGVTRSISGRDARWSKRRARVTAADFRQRLAAGTRARKPRRRIRLPAFLPQERATLQRSGRRISRISRRVGVHALDDGTLRVELENADARFSSNCVASVHCYPYRCAHHPKNGETRWIKPGHIVVQWAIHAIRLAHQRPSSACKKMPPLLGPRQRPPEHGGCPARSASANVALNFFSAGFVRPDHGQRASRRRASSANCAGSRIFTRAPYLGSFFLRLQLLPARRSTTHACGRRFRARRR